MDNILESSTDQRREQLVDHAILAAFPHLTLHKCPPVLPEEDDPRFAKVDRVVQRDQQVVAYFEYRCRNIVEATYGDVSLNFRKYAAMQQIKRYTTCPVYFIVTVNSGTVWAIEVDMITTHHVKPGSRIQTRANHGVGPHDEEDMIKIFFPAYAPEDGCFYKPLCHLSDALRADFLATWEEDADRRAHPLKYSTLPHPSTLFKP